MYRYVVTGETNRLLTRLALLRRQLDSRGVVPRRWLARLRREIEAEAVAASVAMAGVPVTVEQVRHVLAGQVPPTISVSVAAATTGYRDAMTFVSQCAEAPGFVWRADLFGALHARISRSARSGGASEYRHLKVVVGSRGRVTGIAPEPERIPELLDDLAAWLGDTENTSVSIPVRAALAHIRLAGIRPFADGNGAVAHLVASLVMLRGRYRQPEFTGLEAWWGAHRDEYATAFDCLRGRWRPTADVTRFVDRYVRALVAHVEARSRRNAIEFAIWVALEDTATEDLDGAPRLTEALFDAFFGRSVTNRHYRSLVEVGAATAANDLRRLEASGLLSSLGAGSTTSYVGTARLLAAVATAAGMASPDVAAPLEDQRSAVIAGVAGSLRLGPGLSAGELGRPNR